MSIIKIKLSHSLKNITIRRNTDLIDSLLDFFEYLGQFVTVFKIPRYNLAQKAESLQLTICHIVATINIAQVHMGG